jgi:hypothetical protein
VGKGAYIGFAGALFNPARDFEMYKSTAWVGLCDGTTFNNPDLSLDGQKHIHPAHLASLLYDSSIIGVYCYCAAA